MQNPIFDPSIEVKENEILAKHSTFKIGGEAAYAVFPKNKAKFNNLKREALNDEQI